MLRIATDALTFDDVLLLPAYSQILPSEVTLSSHVSRNIKVNIPMVSSAMDTVTEARLAIAIAQEGGIGVVHKNMHLEQQAKEVRAVKKFESGIIRDPVTIAPTASMETLFNLTRDHGISGVPVVDGEDLVGIITSRDVRFEQRTGVSVRDIMTPRDRLVTAQEGTDFPRSVGCYMNIESKSVACRWRRQAHRNGHSKRYCQSRSVPYGL